MPYNEFEEIIPDIEHLQFTEYDDSYYISSEFDGYRFDYRWSDKPDDNMKSIEAFISKPEN